MCINIISGFGMFGMLSSFMSLGPEMDRKFRIPCYTLPLLQPPVISAMFVPHTVSIKSPQFCPLSSFPTLWSLLLAVLSLPGSLSLEFLLYFTTGPPLVRLDYLMSCTPRHNGGTLFARSSESKLCTR